MTKKQFRLVLALFGLLIVGQWIQTALLRSSVRVQRSAESAEVAGIDTIELSKDILAAQQPAAALPSAETLLEPTSGTLEIAARKDNR